nr:MAG TPA: hypothetical protein [Bacteriophage sp.]
MLRGPPSTLRVSGLGFASSLLPLHSPRRFAPRRPDTSFLERFLFPL